MTFKTVASDSRLGVLLSGLVLGGLTAATAPLFAEDDIALAAMLFLLVVLLASATWGYLVGLFSAVVADFLLNVFFVPPLHTVTVQDPRNVAALVIFLAVAVVGASMLSRLRLQLAVAKERRAELTIMLGLSREIATAPSPQWALEVVARTVTRAVQAKRCDILQRTGGTWRVVATTGADREATREEAALASAAIESGQVVRKLADEHGPRLPRLDRERRQTAATFVPFRPPSGEPGVLHIVGTLLPPAGGDLDLLLRAFGDEAGVAVHRAWLAGQARHAEALQQTDQFKSALLSSVSHDLRSPLTAIKAAVGSLRTEGVEWSEADRAQLLETIESQTDRLTGLVTDLLNMSRLEGGAVRPTIEPLEVQALFQDAVIATQAATSGRTVCVDAPEGLWIRADHGLVLQSLTNLIENASKYSTAGGTIWLRAAAGAGRVDLDVVDEGPGISAAELPHIFERFYRGAEGKRLHGTGLGLAIVRAMVELCGGHVNVESSPAGSTFRISLPPSRPPK